MEHASLTRTFHCSQHHMPFWPQHSGHNQQPVMALKQSLTDNNRPITRPNGQNIHSRGNESENITHPFGHI